ncbi:MAG TPA: 16S rRNA (adenine(1518)-N(6)/adenine(1519)-N(6))-dimethyltransferase RsmA [Terriglobia bacterium]|nr:16S rRNA (adenine(1518)-N(6)/adenine(1519)-N(6))-dimethyltransferase RsmA [Terriglobia bacterium]
MLRKKPRLGQHFLADERLARRLTEAAGVHPDDLVIEIGPGRGAMTRLLADQCARLVAVEIDPTLAANLRTEFQNEAQVEILHADILRTSLASVLSQRGYNHCFVFGNLPYYITSPILHRLFGFHNLVRAMATVVQLEVAERITAKPGSRDYGYLSVLAQLYSSPRIALKIRPGAFTPPPNVKSALILFPMARRFPAWDMQTQTGFLSFVKRSFASKRKNLLNNLSGLRPRTQLESVLKKLGQPLTARAEEVSIDELARLYETLRALPAS